ncbi:MAG: ABC transporter permease [Oscillospiraceae bacterium]|nr:ABC transporter permease [Oscillospiraceae bacterium]
MTKYIVKRTVLGLVTLIIVSMLTFFLMNMIPGGPFLAEKSPTKAVMAALNKKYGLDQPVIVQYKNYMAKAIKGDLGPSIKQRGRNVSDIIATKFPVSAKIGGISLALALIIGIPMGCIAAFNRGKWLDSALIVVATCGIAVPSFVVSTVLMYTFSMKLGWLPTYGLDTFGSYLMPVAALAFYPTAYICRLMRSSMLDVLGQDYMRTARAKGLSQTRSIFKHALRNAIMPIITYLGPAIAYTLTGSLVVEKIFTIPGLGKEFVSSIINRDYMMIMGTTIFLAAIIIIMNVVVDIAYKLIDPRIQLK